MRRKLCVHLWAEKGAEPFTSRDQGGRQLFSSTETHTLNRHQLHHFLNAALLILVISTVLFNYVLRQSQDAAPFPHSPCRLSAGLMVCTMPGHRAELLGLCV